MKRILILLAFVVPVITATGLAIAADVFDDARSATARYNDVNVAIAAGYSFRLPELSGQTCIGQLGSGQMGVHMVNTSLLDGTISAETPEALVYEPRKRTGELKLVALEYVVFESAWGGAQPPALFGRQFDYVPAPNRFGLPAFYALHAWIWKANPSGILSPWNPTVSC